MKKYIFLLMGLMFINGNVVLADEVKPTENKDEVTTTVEKRIINPKSLQMELKNQNL